MDRSFLNYEALMKPFQFRSHRIIEEDIHGNVQFKVPFHFQSHVKPHPWNATNKMTHLINEMKYLPTSLPLSPTASVFVCHDETRLDIMKALITGHPDTPYANGCFEFDIFFPDTYPSIPMVVNLMTTGQGTVRFNPNLYNNGTVCLSILNTWQGSPEERWNSQTSSLLQVLISLQSLVMIDKPYFNEPGFECYSGTAQGATESFSYNANLYASTVQWAMLHQLKNPSPCFKEHLSHLSVAADQHMCERNSIIIPDIRSRDTLWHVIRQHFFLRRADILAQCEKWKSWLSEGIPSYPTKTSVLRENLRSLKENLELLRTELMNISL